MGSETKTTFTEEILIEDNFVDTTAPLNLTLRDGLNYVKSIKLVEIKIGLSALQSATYLPYVNLQLVSPQGFCNANGGDIRLALRTFDGVLATDTLYHEYNNPIMFLQTSAMKSKRNDRPIVLNLYSPNYTRVERTYVYLRLLVERETPLTVERLPRDAFQAKT